MVGDIFMIRLFVNTLYTLKMSIVSNQMQLFIYGVKAYEETFNMDEVSEPLRFVNFSEKNHRGKYSQVVMLTKKLMPLGDVR